MKLLSVIALNKALSEISSASEVQPKDFPVLLKLVVSENLRLCAPHYQDYEKLRVDLIKQFGVQEGEQWAVKPDSPKLKEFSDEFQKLADSEVGTKFRRIYEKELKEAPLTVTQIGVLQDADVIIPNE
jgi:hypothetical protein